ncbi:hypothetical protein [Micromonospora sp. NPDC005710]|uniref:hypothetical protein n=1 Tax=Micromonospora sp. NPDC005710 TaxID=3157051 RepID=UPI00340B5F24
MAPKMQHGGAPAEEGPADGTDIVRDMLINGCRCTVRVTVDGEAVQVGFDIDDQGQVVGLMTGTLRRADLLTAAKAISATIAGVAVALGLATPNANPGVDEIRKVYPNAFEPWTADADLRLIRRFQEGASMVELCTEFGRNVGGISSRLKLHKLTVAKPTHSTTRNEDYAEPPNEPNGEEWV